MLKVVSLQSSATDLNVARQELLRRADEALGIHRPQAGLLFSSYEQTPEHREVLEHVLGALQQQFPAIQLIGSTMTSGFAGSSGYCKHGFFLTLFVSEEIEYRSGLMSNLKHLQRDDAGLRTALTAEMPLLSGEQPCVSLIFSAYDEVDGDRLVADVQQAVGEDCVVFGGIASAYWSDQLMDEIATGQNKDAPATQHALQFSITNGQVQIGDGALAFLNLYGDLEVDVQYTYGWSSDGRQYDLTMKDRVIEQINDVDAVTYLKKMNHPLVAHRNITSYPFWIHENDKPPYQRDVFYNEADGTLYTGHSNWTEGTRVSVSFSFPEAPTLEKEYREMLAGFKDEYDFAFSVACASRVVAQRASITHEADDQASQFVDTSLLGGYFFGEFFPWQGTGQSESGALLHSCSSAVLAIKTPDKTTSVTAPSVGNMPDPVSNLSVQDGFLKGLLDQRNDTIAELEEQLKFFEGRQSTADLNLLKDVLGILLNKSHRTVNAHAVELVELFKQHYADEKPPYPVSRARLIAKLNPLKKAGSAKFFDK